MRIIRLYLAFAATAFACVAADHKTATPADVRTRVVIAENPRATVAFEPVPSVIQTMVDAGITKLTGKSNLAGAWRSFLTTNDVVGLKVYSGPGANSGTRPAVVGAVIADLLKAGLPNSNIIVWDNRLVNLRLAGFEDLAQSYNVRVIGAADYGFDPNVSYDNSIMGNLLAGDLDFDRSGKTTGRYSYLSRLVTHTLTKIIVISPLLNHNLAGVCGNLYSLALGSADNTQRFEASAERLSTAVPEIYAKPALSDHVALCITDALIGQYQGEQLSLLHYSAELNQLWFSKDPVALDVLAQNELVNERAARNIQGGTTNIDLFHNASFFLELGTEELSKIRVETVK